MPELPEVETICNDLKQKILHKKIKQVQVKKPKLVKNNKQKFINTLKNNQLVDIQRIGKLIIGKLADDHYLLIHLKMTGQLIYQNGKNITAGGHNWPPVELLPNKYSHVIISFTDKSQLFFNDLRQFGYLHLVKVQDKNKIVGEFGIEPLQPNFTWQNFVNLFKNKKTVLKALLLNQKLIAGLGNIYVDEVCWRAQVLPTRRVNTLTIAETKKLYQACIYIIKKAIAKRGTTFSDYRDPAGKKGNFVKYLKVYGRSKQACLRCGSIIKKIKLNGRGTHFCSNCQH